MRKVRNDRLFALWILCIILLFSGCGRNEIEARIDSGCYDNYVAGMHQMGNAATDWQSMEQILVNCDILLVGQYTDKQTSSRQQNDLAAASLENAYLVKQVLLGPQRLEGQTIPVTSGQEKAWTAGGRYLFFLAYDASENIYMPLPSSSVTLNEEQLLDYTLPDQKDYPTLSEVKKEIDTLSENGSDIKPDYWRVNSVERLYLYGNGAVSGTLSQISEVEGKDAWINYTFTVTGITPIGASRLRSVPTFR